jgi:RNA polymerase sigma-70 factor (ECF subfamily)
VNHSAPVERRASLEAMFRSDPQRLRRRSISLGVHPADADDIAQTAALRAWRSVDTLRSIELGTMCSWLDTIARNTVRDISRGRRFLMVPLEESPDENATVEDDAETRAAVREVIRRLDGLPENYRVPLLLSALEGLSAFEIAEKLGLTPATVRQRVSRARKMLIDDDALGRDVAS